MTTLEWIAESRVFWFLMGVYVCHEFYTSELVAAFLRGLRG